MMCIRGRQHPMHSGIVSGRVYNVYPYKDTCACLGSKPVMAEGSVFTFRGAVLRCRYCGRARPAYGLHVPWNPNRFVPWEEPKVTVEEANGLYAPNTIFEDILV